MRTRILLALVSRYISATSLAFLLATLASAAEEPTTQIGPSDGTPLAKETAKEEVTVDPISPDALREAIEAFEARKSFDAEATSAQRLRRNASPSGEKARDQIPPYVSPQPPKDVHSHQGTEATTVSVPAPESRPATALKAKPGTKPEKLRSPALPDDPYTLDFVGSRSVPGPGVDPLIEAQQRKQKGGETYAFLMMDSFPDARVVERLAQFGVKALGPHGTALKVRIPLSDQTLAEIARLPGFRSLSYASIDQKFSPDLKNSAERLAKEPERLPVIVNLFDGDDDGRFATQMRGTGAEVGHYDAQLRSYQALATPDQLRALAALDFVLFLEIERRGGGGHDQSMATNGVDYIRSAGFFGGGTVLGLLDSGAMLGSAAATMHDDLNKNGCGVNFTSDAAGVWNDQNGHGTHVLATIAGAGTAQARYRGVATALGGRERIRVGKIWKSDNTGLNSWLRDAIDYMADTTSCDAPRPWIVNLSGGASGSGQNGTDSESRKLDARVWETRQAYIVCSGNSGPGAQTIWSPGVAKNALTVGNVQDSGATSVGEIANTSSRGPTGDNRMKPDLVATGRVVTSAQAGTTNGYTDKSGCSMATPHVTGIAATLLEHYPDFRNRPHLLRAHLMASATLHSDQTSPANNTAGGRNDYGLGRVSDYQSHWARFDSNGWSGRWAWMTITDKSWGHFDIDIPRGTRRLVVVLTWDEPEASAGATQAVTYDVDLWADAGANCTPDSVGQCGQWASQSDIDNVEYLVIDNPPPGVMRLKAINWRAPSFGLPVAIAAKIVRGDSTPAISLTAVPSTTTPTIGSSFSVTTRVSNPSYEAYGVQVSAAAVPSGLTLLGVSTTREDGVSMNFTNTNDLTLGTITESGQRGAVWSFRANAGGPQTMRFRAWSNNGGTAFQSVTVTP